MFSNFNQAIYKQLLILRNTDAAVSTLLLKTKAMEIAKKKMNIGSFHASEGWLKCWKNATMCYSFKMVSGEGNEYIDQCPSYWSIDNMNRFG